jgi:hypothetical protein
MDGCHGRDVVAQRFNLASANSNWIDVVEERSGRTVCGRGVTSNRTRGPRGLADYQSRLLAAERIVSINNIAVKAALARATQRLSLAEFAFGYNRVFQWATRS